MYKSKRDYKSKTGYDTIPEVDFQDALIYYCDITECNPNYIIRQGGKISKIKYDYVYNIDGIDTGSFGGGEETGWLLDVPRKDWANELQSAYSRDFEHIIEQYEKKIIRPVIIINGILADGRGRSMFFYSINEKVPYVEVEM